MNDPHIRAKVDSYDNHLFVVLPVLSIKVRSSADEALSEKENQLLKSKVRWCYSCIAKDDLRP